MVELARQKQDPVEPSGHGHQARLNPPTIDGAFAVLHAIATGVIPIEVERWRGALKAISWIEESRGRLTVTAAGLVALRQHHLPLPATIERRARRRRGSVATSDQTIS